jgi:hypothetical protein
MSCCHSAPLSCTCCFCWSLAFQLLLQLLQPTRKVLREGVTRTDASARFMDRGRGIGAQSPFQDIIEPWPVLQRVAPQSHCLAVAFSGHVKVVAEASLDLPPLDRVTLLGQGVSSQAEAGWQAQLSRWAKEIVLSYKPVMWIQQGICAVLDYMLGRHC